ncbi:hypothetical protein ACEPPN_013454 [Leptodophora sp. 'Broadleaf-Isolate-01']
MSLKAYSTTATRGSSARAASPSSGSEPKHYLSSFGHSNHPTIPRPSQPQSSTPSISNFSGDNTPHDPTYSILRFTRERDISHPGSTDYTSVDRIQARISSMKSIISEFDILFYRKVRLCEAAKVIWVE